jgi:hypothetical protein
VNQPDPPPPPVVLFGDVDAGMAAAGLTVRTSIEALPEARFQLALAATPNTVDYLSTLTIRVADEGGAEHQIFQGSVVDVKLEEGQAVVSCGSGRSLDEVLIGRFVAAFVPSHEVAYMAARSAGLADERIVMPALKELPVQVFEIAVPLLGVELDEVVQIGPVRLLPKGMVGPMVNHLESNDSGIVAEFLDAPAYALTLVTDAVAFRAEAAGLQTIDWVLAWVTMRLRYGSVRLPDKRPQAFSRQQARARARRGELVALRGLLTGVRWLRQVSPEPLLPAVGAQSLRAVAAPGEPPIALRQALLAAQRAATDPDPIQRASAVSEAIEFLVRDVKSPKTLEPAQLRLLRATMKDALAPEHHGRIDPLLQRVNDMPLMAKLALLIEREGIPFSDGDFALLKLLRNVRNDAGHGGQPVDLPYPEDLDHAVALLSRLLLYRLHRDDRAREL